MRHPPPTPDFTTDQRRRLREAVASHDGIDLAAILPARPTLPGEPALLAECYWLSHALWMDADFAGFSRLVGRLAVSGRMSEAEARAFKDVRARAKQLRFAYATLDRRHRYPRLLDRLTRLMGQAQDAAKAGRRARAATRAMLLRLMIAGPPARLLARELGGFAVTGGDALRDHLTVEMRRVRAAVARPGITNAAFHETRKVVSRLVAFYDTLVVLAPTAEHDAVTRYLATINGLMGAMHDDMAARKADDRRGYRSAVEPLPPAVAERLAALVAAFDAPGRDAAAQPLPST